MEFTYGPLVPGAPWKRREQMLPGVQAPPIDFSVTQTVSVKQSTQVNSGILFSGRRPERPGKN